MTRRRKTKRKSKSKGKAKYAGVTVATLRKRLKKAKTAKQRRSLAGAIGGRKR